VSHSERNIVITGAGSGIGAAAARAFSESGDRVHLFDVSQERLDDVAAELKTVKTYLIDVTDAARVREAVESIEKEFGSVDVLVSNAGIFDGLAGIEDTSYELWHKIIETNLTGAFNIIKPASEAMVRQKSGRIITISSIAATRTSPDGLSYDTSKAGLEGMTRRLAVDLGKYGITAPIFWPPQAKFSATWPVRTQAATTASPMRSFLRRSFPPVAPVSHQKWRPPFIFSPAKGLPTSTAR